MPFPEWHPPFSSLAGVWGAKPLFSVGRMQIRHFLRFRQNGPFLAGRQKQELIFGKGMRDSNFSIFRVRRFTEWPGPLYWIAFPVEILTKPLIHWIASSFFTENPFFFTEKCFVASPSQKSALTSAAHLGEALFRKIAFEEMSSTFRDPRRLTFRVSLLPEKAHGEGLFERLRGLKILSVSSSLHDPGPNPFRGIFRLLRWPECPTTPAPNFVGNQFLSRKSIAIQERICICNERFSAEIPRDLSLWWKLILLAARFCICTWKLIPPRKNVCL